MKWTHEVDCVSKMTSKELARKRALRMPWLSVFESLSLERSHGIIAIPHPFDSPPQRLVSDLT